MESVVFKRLYFIFISTVICFSAGQVFSETPVEENVTSLGADYPRKIIQEQAVESNRVISEKYKQIYQKMKSNSLTDKEHVSGMLKSFKQEHNRWVSYRESHCDLMTYIFVYPAQSKMAAAQYYSCILSMNKRRMRYFEDILIEFDG